MDLTNLLTDKTYTKFLLDNITCTLTPRCARNNYPVSDEQQFAAQYTFQAMWSMLPIVLWGYTPRFWQKVR